MLLKPIRTARQPLHFYMALMLILISGACAPISECSGRDYEALSKAVRPAVLLEKFLQLSAGMKQEDVDKLLRNKGKHQFTYLDADGNVTLLRYYSVSADEESDYQYSFDLLFENGSLIAMIDGQDVTDHFKALRGGAPSPIPPKRIAFDDDTQIREYFNVKSFRGEALAKSKDVIRKRVLNAEREWKEFMENRRLSPNLPALLLLEAMDLETEYKVNAEQAKEFDAEKITIGQTETEVNQIFGAPKFNKELDDSTRVAIYGPDQPRAVAPDVAASPVMVLFRDGKVIRVQSNGYFNIWWRDEIWPRPVRPENPIR